MAVLIYNNIEGVHSAFPLPRERELLRIGSDASANQLVLPAALGVAVTHAAIVRISNGLPILVDLAGRGITVNGVRVVSLKVLRHDDQIGIGRVRLTLREMEITRLTAGASRSAGRCPVCKVSFQDNDEIISCPRCQFVHHRNCWFSMANCSTYACDYRIQETVMNALAKQVKFQRRLEADSELAQKAARCAARAKRDMIAFQKGDTVAHCPGSNCRAIFHLSCWAGFDSCTKCGYRVKQLLDGVFAPNPDAHLVG